MHYRSLIIDIFIFVAKVKTVLLVRKVKTNVC